MALLTLKSDNPKFSYCIVANPEIPLAVKPFKKGAFFGFYTKENEYAVYFKDDIKKDGSFKPHPNAGVEYLNINELADARFANYAIDKMFRTAYNGSEYDAPGNHSITLFAVETNERVPLLFSRYFNTDEIHFEKLSSNCFKVTLAVTNKTISYLLKLTPIFSLFTSIEGNDNFIYIEDGFTEKYLKLLNDVKAPYFIKYVFKVATLRSEVRFNKLKHLLSEGLEHETTFTFGDTHKARMDAIYNVVNFGTTISQKELKPNKCLNILDIGAGFDYKYLKMFYAELANENKTYYAVERDENAYAKIKQGIDSRAISNVKLFKTFDEFIAQYEGEEVNVICTEVLEHNEVKDAKVLVNSILNTINFNKIIFTVPNKDFNKFYCLGNSETRHIDHKWEPTKNEFKEFMATVDLKKRDVVTNYDVGDKIIIADNTVSPTQLVLITRNDM